MREGGREGEKWHTDFSSKSRITCDLSSFNLVCSKSYALCWCYILKVNNIKNNFKKGKKESTFFLCLPKACPARLPLSNFSTLFLTFSVSFAFSFSKSAISVYLQSVIEKRHREGGERRVNNEILC